MLDELKAHGFGTEPMVKAGFYEFVSVATGERHIRWCVVAEHQVFLTHVRGQPWLRLSSGAWAWRGPIEAPEVV